MNWVHIESHWMEVLETSPVQTNIVLPVWNLLTGCKATARSLCHRLGMIVRCPYDFMGPTRASCGDLSGSLRLSQESTIIFGPKWQSKTLRCPHNHCAVPARGSYNVTAMCLQAKGLQFFQICHYAELNKIVEATIPVNPYDDRKVSLRRPHGNGDLDIVGASYTHRKANVTEALQMWNMWEELFDRSKVYDLDIWPTLENKSSILLYYELHNSR